MKKSEFKQMIKEEIKAVLKEDVDHYTIMYSLDSLSKYIRNEIKVADPDSTVFVNNHKKLKKYETAYQDFLNSIEAKISDIAKEAVAANKKLWQIKTGK